MPLGIRAALTPPHASLAQLVEHRTFNARVRSSSLRRRTIQKQEGKAQDTYNSISYSEGVVQIQTTPGVFYAAMTL